MKKNFLEYVAHDLIAKYGCNLSRIAVVFPNKRASLFMNEYLAREARQPMWSPAYITISELFRDKSALTVADPIKQVCDLYRSFTTITGSTESLDHFYGWGQLLLADFDDIDKNMADAHQVFANLKDIHELDNVDYLNQDQRDILKKFFSNFSDDHTSELKKRFLSLWCHFEDIYHDFNQRLEQQGLAYEGALYRRVAEDDKAQYTYDAYAFVGFNVLQQVECQLFRRLQQMGKALFYWDFDNYYLSGNEAGHYINKYLYEFGNELDNDNAELYNNLSAEKDITYIASTTESAQAHYITSWIKANGRIAAGRKTAIVLCDESLLQTVIHCLPPEVTKVNITTGYPLAQSPVASLVQLLLSLQNFGRVRGTDKYRLHEVSKALQHPYMRFLSDQCTDLVSRLQQYKCYYPTRRQLSADDGLALLFSDIEERCEDYNLSTSQWILDLLKLIGHNALAEKDALRQESIFRMYMVINRLSSLIASGDLTVDRITFERLVTQLIQSTTIPFHGEPAEGIQIMGVLETRNLDFDHILVLSASEGNMPKGTNDASFIPYSIRKAYGLTTIDNKVAIYAYYFHRLLQRATDITLTYNHATEEGHTGEMSRFMIQFMVESAHTIKHKTLMPEQTFTRLHPITIGKSAEVISRLDSIDSLSPTAINRYLYCPLTFYYNVIQKIKEPDESDEDLIDNRVFGNIFHRSAELIYSPFVQSGQKVLGEDIEQLLKHGERIEMIVDQAFRELLFKVDESGYIPEYNGLQLINRGVIISYLRKLLEIDRKLTPFRILGLEKRVETTIQIDTPTGVRPLNLYGFIDRLDEVTDSAGQRIRVIDYKTGRLATKRVTTIDELFTGEDYQEKHTNYYLQATLYALIVSHEQTINDLRLPVSPALIFIQHTAANDYDPTLLLDRDKMIRATDFEQEFDQGLKRVLQQIFDPSQPFSPTPHRERCANCVYRNLCHQ